MFEYGKRVGLFQHGQNHGLYNSIVKISMTQNGLFSKINYHEISCKL
jgi:hypothetical protein